MVTLRSSGRKQQTRLSFNPLPTSSPAASGLHEQIQHRAAAVRYDTMASPTKKRRLRSHSGQAKLDFDAAPSHITNHLTASNKMALPTPEPSSQIEAKHENVGAQSLHTTSSSEDSEPIPVGSTRSGMRKQRTNPQTPQNRRHQSPTSSSSLRFKQVSVPINSPSNTAMTPSRSPKRASTLRHRAIQPTEQQGPSSSRSRRQVDPEADDSGDSLMDELRVVDGSDMEERQPRHKDHPKSREKQ
ncbi:MAG: hypothetical protein Q9226_007974, partial [Calogaya cf. arnoldii]